VTDSRHVADELEIVALLNRYARAVDTKDWELYRSVFTHDAHIDYSADVFQGPLDEAVGFFSGDFSTLVAMSMHYITNVEAEIDGDTARVRAMFYNPTQITGVAEMSMFGGYYFHDLVRTPDGWRSTRLREQMVWTANPPRRDQV
jgi:3-phenylpropionate/cinnamic acid dioxygenase small subunit